MGIHSATCFVHLTKKHFPIQKKNRLSRSMDKFALLQIKP